MTYQDFDTAESAPRKAATYTPKHALVLRSLRKGPLPDAAIYDRITRNAGRVISPSGCRTRRSELVEMGLVASAGNARTETGAKCKTWKLTETGAARAQDEYDAARQLTLALERNVA